MKLAPLVAVLALAAPATADAAAPLGPVDFTVAKVTHRSSVTRDSAEYHGRSTASWSLARASTFRMSWLAGGLYSGTGRMNVRGQYALDATTSWPGHCAWTSATGDREHPLTAPAPFDLTVAPNPRRPGYATVGYLAVQATLGNAYVGTECASRADEPTWEEQQTLDLRPAKLRAKKVTLRFAGTRTAEGLTATWRTEIVLRRRG
jgi:hypothetical protein